MKTSFGQLVVGPPGSGKTTYCEAVAKLLTDIGRKVAVVNLDPANDNVTYKASVDITDLVTVEDTMQYLNLGPNGGLVYCIEYLETNFQWLLDNLKKFEGYYFIFDCPGQVELYTHHDSMKKIMMQLLEKNFRLCAVQLIDSHYCSDPGKFISALLMSLSSMLQMELPFVNILSKIDMLSKHELKLIFGIDYYMEVLNLSYLLDALQDDPFTKKYKKLNEAFVSLVEDYSLVSFIPLNVKDKSTLIRVKNCIDKANGYIYGQGEEGSVQTLLACAVGAETEQERTGVYMDKYVNDSMDYNENDN